MNFPQLINDKIERYSKKRFAVAAACYNDQCLSLCTREAEDEIDLIYQMWTDFHRNLMTDCVFDQVWLKFCEHIKPYSVNIWFYIMENVAEGNGSEDLTELYNKIELDVKDFENIEVVHAKLTDAIEDFVLQGYMVMQEICGYLIKNGHLTKKQIFDWYNRNIYHVSGIYMKIMRI